MEPENQNKKKNTNVALIVVIVILSIILVLGGLGIGGYFLFKNITANVNFNGIVNQIEDANFNTTVVNENKAEENTTTVENEVVENTVTENTVTENTVTENTVSEENTVTENTVEGNTTVENPSSEGAKVSTKENPLGLGEWGLASKYVSKYLSKEYENTSYTPVPVRVTKVTRGAEAEKIVKKWFEGQKYYKYQDPKAYTEWMVVDYQIDLTKLKFDKDTIGTDRKVSSDVTGLTGGSVRYNDISYIISTKDITTSDYVKKPGVYNGQFIVTIPTGCKEYLVKFGTSYQNGAESFFRIEK